MNYFFNILIGKKAVQKKMETKTSKRNKRRARNRARNRSDKEIDKEIEKKRPLKYDPVTYYPVVKHGNFTYIIDGDDGEYFSARAVFEYPEGSKKYYFIPSFFSSYGTISMEASPETITHRCIDDIKTLDRETCLKVCPGYLD